jgi:glycosyltransferase involved in cell wall biosynthesis
LPPKEQARVELGVAGGGVVVSMIGRLTAIKRPDRFAAVVADSVRRGLDAQYLVAGSGDQEAPLRARVERDRLPVQMLGWRSDLERILAATDIVLLTSDNEGTPLSLVQAGLAGVPAVATRVGSVPEVVQDRVTGLLCDRDPRSLASAVEELATQGDLRRGLGDHARQKAHNEFGLVGFLAQHARLYEALT